MNRVLIVEDDENIAKYINTCLNMGGYESVVCENGKTAIERILNEPFDLVLLDVMLPEIDGFSIMERICSLDIAVIFLTAMQDVSDKVRGLKLGAEDYIVKPFETLELLARIEVVLRRKHNNRVLLTYKDIEMNIENHTVKRGGIPVSLTPKEFDTLAFFVQHQDIVISRERLLATVWGYEFEGESRTVDTHVQQVRRKTNLKGELVSVPKYGYKLIRGEDL